MNVAELRKALEGVPDDALFLIPTDIGLVEATSVNVKECVEEIDVPESFRVWHAKYANEKDGVRCLVID